MPALGQERTLASLVTFSRAGTSAFGQKQALRQVSARAMLASGFDSKETSAEGLAPALFVVGGMHVLDTRTQRT